MFDNEIYIVMLGYRELWGRFGVRQGDDGAVAKIHVSGKSFPGNVERQFDSCEYDHLYFRYCLQKSGLVAGVQGAERSS